MSIIISIFLGFIVGAWIIFLVNAKLCNGIVDMFPKNVAPKPDPKSEYKVMSYRGFKSPTSTACYTIAHKDCNRPYNLGNNKIFAFENLEEAEAFFQTKFRP